MTFLKRSALGLLGLYLLSCAVLFGFQRKFLFIPPSMYLTPAGVGLEGAKEIRLSDGSGDIKGWWMPPKDAGGKTIMFFHGNGSAVFSSHEIYNDLNNKGYGVFAVAYPGYPGRRGESAQESLTQAAQDGYDFVAAQGIPAHKVVYYGTSLGSGVAAQLSKRAQPALIIMEAPFTSVAEMAQKRFPIFPAQILMRDKFDSRSAISEASAPLLWLHGTDDRIIPLAVGQTLFDSYTGPKTSHIIQNGQHTNLWYLGGDDIILEALSAL